MLTAAKALAQPQCLLPRTSKLLNGFFKVFSPGHSCHKLTAPS